jgi:protein-disulfide isomerase
MKRFLPFLIILLVAAGGAAAGMYLYKAKRSELTNIPRPKVAEGETEAPGAKPPHMVGPKSGAKVVLEEFGDFQCPPCGIVAPILDKLQHEFPDKVIVIYRQFPLAMHKHALPASAASEAAANQGKFWEMHKLLYENQEAWANVSEIAPVFEGYAQKIGLDIARYKQDIDSPATKARIEADQARAKSLGVTSTPTVFLNDERVPFTSLTEQALRAGIEAAIAGKKDIFVPQEK